MKVCTQCKVNKKDGEFSKHSAGIRGLQSYCKDCGADNVHKGRYGISITERNLLIKAQDNKCKCCGDELSDESKHIHLDHDHSNGNIRGVVCRACNLAVGWVNDCPERAWKVLKYLENSKEGYKGELNDKEN